MGDQLLKSGQNLIGKSLELIAPILCQDGNEGTIFNFKSNKLLLKCRTITQEQILDGSKLIIYCEAGSNIRHDGLTGPIISDGVDQAPILQQSKPNKNQMELSEDNLQSFKAKYKFQDIIYESHTMDHVVKKCKKIAGSESSVMIYGETGTGKEMFSQSIHNASSRSNGPFIAINCAAIPDTLLESLLFGTEAGAFTGSEQRAGLLEQADHGTLLLDEINSMNIELQSKLLRVLQEGKVRRVGGAKEIPVDLRVISNINMPPFQAIEEGKLRRDLFYRLGVVNINIPTLSDRKEDILILAKKFIETCNSKMAKKISSIDTAVLEIFMLYDWPGNIRELQHAVEHAMNIMPDHAKQISPEYLPEHILKKVGLYVESGSSYDGFSDLNSIKQNVETRAIINALRENSGNMSKTARLLGISRQTLQYRMMKNGIDYKAFKK